MADEEEDTLTNLTPAELATPEVAGGGAGAPSAAVDYADPTAQEPHTDWGPPSAGRYLAALAIVLGISAAGAFVVWYFWGEQVWNTITGDWT